jgi:alpha-tubulin suppressor-like RCC1 family protein
MSRARVVVAVLSTLVVTACEDGTGPNLNNVPGYSITSVRVFPPSAVMFVPDTIRPSDRFTFAAIALSKGGAVLENLRYVWTSSDPSVATVDSSGTVTPVRPGTVEISASAHKVGTATLVILPATQTVEVSPQLDSIFVDEPIVGTRDTTQLSATATDVFGDPLTGVVFGWQSSATTVASVTTSGVVRAVGLGNASVTVSANGLSATSLIRVVPLVASAALSTPPSQVLALDTVQLSAVARNYSNAIVPRTFNWTSSNPSVATVDSTGRVRFLTTGSTTITARTAHRTATTQIVALDRVLTTIDAGTGFTCGVANLGRGYCWGLSEVGQTGAVPDSLCFPQTPITDGPPPCILPPKRMNRPELSFTTISAGGDFACGITTAQLLYCWGDDTEGQVGNGAELSGNEPRPATVKSERFTQVSAGRHHVCALNLTGRAYCWGADGRGQLGDNRTVNSTTPIPISDSTLVFRSISAGDSHTCGVTTTGSAYCWGEGAQGQLGNGTGIFSDAPVLVNGSNSFMTISAGRAHTCAVDTAGSVLCWGDNSFGQLGTGVAGGLQPTPIAVTGASGFSAISAGDDHTCGISSSQVTCWGRSDFGQVGDGTVSSHNVASPSVVAGLSATSISAGQKHTCAMSTAGQAMCWGSNNWGALGNEFQAAIRATPQVVARPR